jgi:hypothetical protein
MQNINVDLNGYNESVTIFRDGVIVAVVIFENRTVSFKVAENI